MDEPRSFVVRVYRDGGDDVVGTVESVATGATAAFRTPMVLWALVCADPPARRPAVSDPSKEDEK
jgi:hypothetical protein